MVRATATRVVAGDLAAVTALWHDPTRWPAWREAFTALVGITGRWPEPDAVATWSSRATAGRGRVRERVVEADALGGVVLQVEDERMHSIDRAAFEVPVAGEVTITLTVDFRLKDRAPLTVIREKLHTRGLIAGGLRRSLLRFARELAEEAELA